MSFCYTVWDTLKAVELLASINHLSVHLVLLVSYSQLLLPWLFLSSSHLLLSLHSSWRIHQSPKIWNLFQHGRLSKKHTLLLTQHLKHYHMHFIQINYHTKTPLMQALIQYSCSIKVRLSFVNTVTSSFSLHYVRFRYTNLVRLKEKLLRTMSNHQLIFTPTFLHNCHWHFIASKICPTRISIATVLLLHSTARICTALHCCTECSTVNYITKLTRNKPRAKIFLE